MFLTLTEIVTAASQKLPEAVWDYVSGGADTEATLRRNRAALDAIGFRPRVLRDVSVVDCTTALLGHALRIPVVLAPVGGLSLVDPGGILAAAQAAEAFGVLPFVGIMGSPSFETVAAETRCPLVLQLYIRGDRAWLRDVVDRARAAGYRALCLTVDTAQYSRRERDLHRRFSPAAAVDRPNVTELMGEVGDRHQAAVDWDMLAFLRDIAGMPLILKGVAEAEDARLAVAAGVAAIYVSNHGGRQLDHVAAGIEMLPEIVDAVGGAAEIVVDSGFTRGTDVVKALALGARAVGIGKLQAWALAAGGVPALVRALEILEIEIRITMSLLGVSRVADLNKAALRALPPLGGGP